MRVKVSGKLYVQGVKMRNIELTSDECIDLAWSIINQCDNAGGLRLYMRLPTIQKLMNSIDNNTVKGKEAFDAISKVVEEKLERHKTIYKD